MKTWTGSLAFAISGAVFLMTTGNSPAQGPEDKDRPSLNYPQARRGDVVENYHGTRVADPYRWLEDIDSAETRAWVEAENRVTDTYLESIPERSKIKDRLTKLWDYEKYGIPDQEGGRYFYTYNTGLQNQSVLFTTKSLGGDARELLDPNTLSKDGTVALSGLSITEDGSKMAYALADAGSDWMKWKVRNVETGEDTPDEILWSKFSGAEWTPDGSGFFYGRFPEPKEGDDLKAANYFQKMYFHKLGTAQKDDLLIWKDDEHKDWRADPTVTDDGKYLVLTLGKGTDDKYRILYRPLDKPDAEPVHLVGNFDHEYTFIDNDGPIFWF
ncbi:MAG TPA: S9 family peptidase, partial [Isosphaeraceae bacterium]|nr:S9 family peptidase [Isosphaeraceae bacterium]